MPVRRFLPLSIARTAKASGDAVESTERVVIVGGGMAAHHLVESLVASAGEPELAVTLICDETELPYDRIHLGAVVEGEEDPPRFRSTAWYETHGVDVLLKNRVIDIDRENGRLTTSTGATIEYDRLVLATGSHPFVPPLPGAERSGVLAYRTFEDASQIAREAKEAERVVVIGGGLLGLELARGIQRHDCQVDIVEMAPRLLPRQLDVAGAAILAGTIRSLGLELHLGVRTKEILEKGDGLELVFEDGNSLSADLIVFAIGTRPSDALARRAGLECHREGGILVDDRMGTNDPRIQAIGECVRHGEATYGFVAPCYRMAEVLADRIRGEKTRFTSPPISARLKLSEISVTAVGESLADGTLVRDLVWRTSTTYRRIVIRDGRLVGVIAVGEMPELARLQEAIARRTRIRPAEERRFRLQGELWRARDAQRPIASWSDGAIVCTCTGVTCGTLKSAVAQGHRSSLALQDATGAGTGCGSCQPLLAELCGEASTGQRHQAGPGLAAAAIVGIALVASFLAIGPIPMSTSVLDRPQIDFLWRESFWKQVSGFSLVGAMVAGLVFPLRDRLPKWARLEFSNARVTHSVIGLACLVFAAVHTGLRMGANLNWFLMLFVVGVLVLGIGSALVSGLEHRLPQRMGSVLRTGWRNAHAAVVLPIPVLLLFHVLAVYFY